MKVSDWIVVDNYCSARIVEGGNIDNINDRVAFIEKTPRVRTGFDKKPDCRNWHEGPKGAGGSGGDDPLNELYGFYPPSRYWCDMMLSQMGYEL